MCYDEGCELEHCRKCGGHYEPSPETRNGICDNCIIQRGYDEAEAATKAFGGNYEEAARFLGW